MSEPHTGGSTPGRIPAWWSALFLSSVLALVGYGAVYHLSPAVMTPTERWSSVRRHTMERLYARIDAIQTGDEKLLMLMRDADWMEIGDRLYTLRCAQCHGPDGRGVLGPNLTDDAYKNVRTLADIETVVREGAGGGTMPAHRGVMSPGQISVVSAYVASLRGSNRPGPRGAEGSIIPPWPEYDAVP